MFFFKLHECLVGVETCSSVWLQLLLKPAKWKQERRGHSQRKDFAPPRLLFCYLGKAAFIGKVPVSHPEPFFRLYCWEGEIKHNRYPEPSAGLQAQPRVLLHTHPFSPPGLRLQWDRASVPPPFSQSAINCLLQGTATTKCLQSGNFQLPQAEVWVPWGSSPPALGWLVNFEELEKPL